MENNKGIFISIEGIDGSGKTTLINNLKEKLNQKYDNVFFTREPGGSKLSESIRDLVLGFKFENMSARTEVLLFASSRSSFVSDVIEPSLKDGKIVISDRYVDSSIAYQGKGRDLGMNNVEKLNLFADNGIMPELTILLDIDPKVSLDRIKKTRKNEVNRLDVETDLNFYNEVRKGYLELAKKHHKRIKVIDASKNEDYILSESLKIIEDLINSKG